MTGSSPLRGRTVVPGRVRGPVLVSPTAVSFLGDVDIASGRIVSTTSPIRGEVVTGRILVMPRAVGSAGAWRFLYQLHVHGRAPTGIVIGGAPDSSLVQGALLAEIPVMSHVGEDVTGRVPADAEVELDSDAGTLRVLNPTG